MADSAQILYKAESSGVTFVVTPLNTLAQKVLRAKSYDGIAFPVEKDYEIPAGELDFDKDAPTFGHNNPEFIAALEAARNAQGRAFWHLVLETAVDLHEGDREKEIKRRRRAIDMLRAASASQPIAGDFESDWTVLVMGFLANEKEVTELISLSQGALPVNEFEIREGFRLFRRLDV